MSGQVGVDPEQTARFVNALFRHANEGGFVLLRAFYDDELAKRRAERPFKIRTIRLNGRGLEPVIQAAVKLAEEAAAVGRPVVVAPPIATFARGKADEKGLLEGLSLSVELDERAAEALGTLRAVLGRPTVIVESGGVWVDPNTGEAHPKLHVHWRLSEPTQTPDEHRLLKRARTLACDLVGGDATSKPAVHPMRWPGTLHRKNPAAPRVSRIVEENADVEIHLDDALSELEGLVVLRDEVNDERPLVLDANPTDDDELLRACAERIDNPDLDWAAWNRLGMAFWRASEGSEAGFAAFDSISRKSAKYDAEATRARWEHYRTSPPERIGIRTLVWEARKNDPTFRKTRAEAPASAACIDDDWETKLAAAIAELNARYFVADVGGRSVIGSLVRDDALERERLVFSRREDVKLLFNHRHYIVGFSHKDNEIWRDLGTAWLEHPQRRTYDRIALLPDREAPPGVYNLWRGWGIQPKAGAWPRIREHLRDVICAGNPEYFNYLIGWLAYVVQHPERQAEVAVVLRGLKGTGKGTLGQMLVRIFRDHALHVTHSRHLTGHFNAHLADTLFLFLDEAFWGGDKQGEGVLKALITERTLMIEPKGVDPFTMPNRLKILMASNAEWVVPASADERRYFVLDVSEYRRGDHGYFDALYAAIGGEELPAFLHHLLTRNLSGFEVRDPPHTKELARQKLIGTDSVGQFWLDCLTEGAIVGTPDPGWPRTIVTQLLNAAYLDHAKAHGERHPKTANHLMESLRKFWEGCAYSLKRESKPWVDPITGEEVRRPNAYALDSLENHRRAFLAAMKIDPADHDWPELESAE